ncbi:hypothetical protein K8R78_07855, partial [bacterium]|nr:hypothetical protein [bacterium]
SDEPAIVLTDIPDEQTVDVTIAYELSDREGDPLSIVPEFSRDGGATWEAASTTGQLEGISSSAYRSSLTWHSKSDTDMLDLFEVQFRLTPSDNDVGMLDATANFQVDNSDTPQISLATPEGEQSDSVTIIYELSDREGDGVELAVEYSGDNGASWQTATVSGSTSGVRPGAGSLSWSSRADVDQRDGDYLLRITPSDNDIGLPDQTNLFQVDNSDVPSINLYTPEGEQTAEVTLNYDLSDREGDDCALTVEYSTDGTNWRSASTTGQLIGVTPGTGSLVWNSTFDLDSVDLESVYLRVTPADNDSGEPAQTASFHLDNSEPPLIDLDTPEGEQTGEVTIGYNLSDREGDATDLVVEVSLDGGSSWQRATILETLTNITPGFGSLTWDSSLDAPGADLNAVMLRALPRDNDDGTAGQTGIFPLDNNEPPTAELTIAEGVLSGMVAITITPHDPEYDPVDCELEYSIGGSWLPVSISDSLLGLTSAITIYWDSFSDLGEIYSEGSLRVIPADNDIGTSTMIPFTINNAPAPPEPEPPHEYEDDGVDEFTPTDDGTTER